MKPYIVKQYATLMQLVFTTFSISMASFSPKKYFSKIQSPEVLIAYYKTHTIQAFFEINEQTPRKQAVEIMMDFYKSLDPAKKYDIDRELALLHSLSTKYAPTLFINVLKKSGVNAEITTLECITDHDKVMYYYTHHKDIVNDVLFYHDFYTAKGYMLYEAKKIDLSTAEMNMNECAREFTRLANKEDRVTECEVTTKTLGDLLYVEITFDGVPVITQGRDKETGEVNKTKTTRKLERIRIVYLPEDNEVIISASCSKYEKLIFLDTFLRIVCNSGYEDKVQAINLSPFTQKEFDLKTTNKGIPLLTWKVRAVTLAYGEGKSKKKVRLTIPSTIQEYGLTPLFSTLEELGLEKTFTQSTLENITLSLSFTATHAQDKAVSVSCSLSGNKIGLSPLLPYDRYARTLLKLAGIDNGFIEKATKEKEDVAKKWQA